MLLGRIYEAFPLNCPICHSQMHNIAFINDTTTLHKILNHIGESTLPPKIAQARGPPLWKAASAAEIFGDAAHVHRVPADSPINFDQRIGRQRCFGAGQQMTCKQLSQALLTAIFEIGSSP